MPTQYEEGNPNAKICILGEAPSYREVRLGRPLVGPSGQLLDQLLHQARLIRRECYVLNVFENEVKKDKSGGVRDREGNLLWTAKGGYTGAGEVASAGCRARLGRSTSNVYVPLGGTATSLLTRESKITKYRGSILAGTIPGVEKRILKTIPTLHPAYSLRGMYTARYPITSDLARARDQSGFPEIRRPHRDLLIDPSYAECMAYMKNIEDAKEFATDIECLNHQVSCFSLSHRTGDAISVPLLDERGNHRWSEWEEASIWRQYAHLLGRKDIRKINQNIAFDLAFLCQQNHIHYRGPLEDTMIAHHIMWPDLPKGLDYLCSIWTDEPYYKDDGKLWKKPWADPHTFWEYNAKDSIVALEIWHALEPLLKENEYWDTYRETMDLLPVLMYMQIRGMKVDKDALEKTKVEVAEKLAQKEIDLLEAAEEPFNPGSPKQCIAYFYGTKGIKPYINRKTGNPTTDDKAMSRIVRRYNLPEARLVQEIRALKKLSGTYLEVGIDKDERIRCSYNPRGTTTGRLSSSQTIFGSGLNMQNLHSEFKGFLVAG